VRRKDREVNGGRNRDLTTLTLLRCEKWRAAALGREVGRSNSWTSVNGGRSNPGRQTESENFPARREGKTDENRGEDILAPLAGFRNDSTQKVY